MNVTRVDPPTAADERATLESFLDFARASVRHKCEGVSDSDARRCFGQAPEMSLAGIVSHLRWVEAAWFEVALRGEKNRADDCPAPRRCRWPTWSTSTRCSASARGRSPGP